MPNSNPRLGPGLGPPTRGSEPRAPTQTAILTAILGPRPRSTKRIPMPNPVPGSDSNSTPRGGPATPTRNQGRTPAPSPVPRHAEEPERAGWRAGCRRRGAHLGATALARPRPRASGGGHRPRGARPRAEERRRELLAAWRRTVCGAGRAAPHPDGRGGHPAPDWPGPRGGLAASRGTDWLPRRAKCRALPLASRAAALLPGRALAGRAQRHVVRPPPPGSAAAPAPPRGPEVAGPFVRPHRARGCRRRAAPPRAPRWPHGPSAALGGPLQPLTRGHVMGQRRLFPAGP